MDWMRSCYTVPMIHRTGDPAIMVKWYFADADAKTMESMSPFRSSIWAPGEDVAGDLGEQPGARGWANGAKPSTGWSGDETSQLCSEFHSEWWENGLGSGDETGPFSFPGVPTCCVDGPPELPCEDCSAVPDADLTIVFNAPDCDCLDAASYNLTWNAFPGNWTINGVELCDECPLPNFGAVVVSRVLASEPCTLLLEGGQLFCDFDLGIVEAEAVCDGEGNFLFCTFSGTIGGGGPCDGAAYTATLTVT